MKILILFILIIYIQLFGNAQNPEWINLRNGQKVRTLVDEDSVIWIGTSEGLLKVDKMTKNSILYNQSHGVPDPDITAIVIDSSGNKWIGMYGDEADNKFAKFDGTSWTTYEIGTDKIISALDIDKKNNTVWIATSRDGWSDVEVYSFNEGIYIDHNIPNINGWVEWLRCIKVDSNSHVWVGHNELGLFKFDGINWEVYDISNSGLPDNDVYCVEIDSYNRKWIGTANGLALFDDSSWNIYNTSNSGLSGNTITSVKIDKKNFVWIGTTQGLVKYDGTNWIIYNSSNSNLPSNNITNIEIDRYNIKWIGTLSGMISYNDICWFRYKTYHSGLPNNYVWSIAMDNKNNKWIGTNYGLAKFDGTTWQIFNPENSGLTGWWISQIGVDKDGNKWIGTYYNGIARYNDTSWTVYDSLNSGLPPNQINAIAFDSQGNKWFGTIWGLVKFDETNWTIYNETNSGLPHRVVNCISIDKNDTKWIGTNNGLAKFNDSSWTVFNKSNSGIQDNNVLSITLKDGVYVGGEYGMVSFFDTSNNSWIVYYQSVGVNPINAITYDISGNIFVLGKKTLNYKGQNYNYYNSPLTGSFFSIIVDSSNNKWIGTSNGLYIYKEEGVCLATISSDNQTSIICDNRNIQLTSNLANNYKWSTGDTTFSIILNSAGFYSLTITDTTGCSSSTSITIKRTPSKNINLGTDQTICLGDSLILSAGLNFCNYHWSDNSNLTALTVNSSGTYWVEVTDSVSCIFRDTIFIESEICTDFLESKLNNFISQVYPNPTNDKLLIKCNMLNEKSPLTFILSDLLGQKIRKMDLYCGSNLTDMGTADLPNGIYIYVFKENNQTIGKGKITINK